VSIDHFEGMARQRFRLPGAQRFYDECLISLTHYGAAQFAAAGVGVVVDTVIARPGWLRDAARQLSPYRAFVVGVHCDLHELRRRERERGDRGTGRAEAQVPLVHPLVRTYGGYDLEVDTNHATPADCVRVIRRFLDTGAAPTALSRIRRVLDPVPVTDAAPQVRRAGRTNRRASGPRRPCHPPPHPRRSSGSATTTRPSPTSP
jgi:chloramphenicol 3-O phosphotransferase